MKNNKNQTPVIKMDLNSRQPALNIPDHHLHAAKQYEINRNPAAIQEKYNQVIKRYSIDSNGGGYAGL